MEFAFRKEFSLNYTLWGVQDFSTHNGCASPKLLSSQFQHPTS
jgi:hypothetical protein